MRKSGAAWLAAGWVVPGAALVFLLLYQTFDRATPALTKAGARKEMPDLTFVDLDGKRWKLGDHRGEVVLVNFWATWCPPCRQETPGLVRLANEYRSKGLEVAGVSMDVGGVDRVRRFVQEYHVPYPVLLLGADSPVASSIKSLPTTFLIDRKGRIASIFAGAMEESVYRRDVEQLLAEE